MRRHLWVVEWRDHAGAWHPNSCFTCDSKRSAETLLSELKHYKWPHRTFQICRYEPAKPSRSEKTIEDDQEAMEALELLLEHDWSPDEIMAALDRLQAEADPTSVIVGNMEELA